jgi:hypothetical protein
LPARRAALLPPVPLPPLVLRGHYLLLLHRCLPHGCKRTASILHLRACVLR